MLNFKSALSLKPSLDTISFPISEWKVFPSTSKFIMGFSSRFEWSFSTPTSCSKYDTNSGVILISSADMGVPDPATAPPVMNFCRGF